MTRIMRNIGYLVNKEMEPIRMSVSASLHSLKSIWVKYIILMEWCLSLEISS